MDTFKELAAANTSMDRADPTEPAICAKPRRKRGALAHCPHCDAPAIIRSSRKHDHLISQLWMLCTNLDCGHSWLCQLSFVHTLALPITPKPGLDLRLGPYVQRALNSASDPPAAR